MTSDAATLRQVGRPKLRFPTSEKTWAVIFFSFVQRTTSHGACRCLLRQAVAGTAGCWTGTTGGSVQTERQATHHVGLQGAMGIVERKSGARRAAGRVCSRGGVVAVGHAAPGRGDQRTRDRRGIIGGGCRFKACRSVYSWPRRQLSRSIHCVVLCLAVPGPRDGQAIGAGCNRLELLLFLLWPPSTLCWLVLCHVLDSRLVLDAIANVYCVVGVIVSAGVLQPRF